MLLCFESISIGIPFLDIRVMNNLPKAVDGPSLGRPVNWVSIGRFKTETETPGSRLRRRRHVLVRSASWDDLDQFLYSRLQIR
ncbi:Protein of unknown function [Pyronema omphalodes CBS 100304]|uniref:Uncharacterized protein n=1 Tax=Pyronema omphalodes (strain CBS 100304) TaxID=1076935 RepID=U4LT79_PYROM|nr:Protein of unknown function [Pyronema omphalodes CBS 100304]